MGALIVPIWKSGVLVSLWEPEHGARTVHPAPPSSAVCNLVVLKTTAFDQLFFFWGGGAESKCLRVLKIALGNWATQVYDTLDPR